MRKNSEQTVGCTKQALGWPSRIASVTSVLAGVLILVLLHSPDQVLSAILPASYSATLKWDASPRADVTGYRVYYGTASGNYTNSVTVGNVTANTVSGLASGVTYFFAVTAVGTAGLESDFSNEASYVPGVPRVRIRVTPAGQVILTVKGLIDHTYDILAMQTGTGWTPIGTVTLGASASMDFTDANVASYPNRLYRTRDTQP